MLLHLSLQPRAAARGPRPDAARAHQLPRDGDAVRATARRGDGGGAVRAGGLVRLQRAAAGARVPGPPAGRCAEAAEPDGYDPAAAALALFHAGAFRDGLAGRILRHFPGKQRLLFVHIPKSAGTDFAATMNRVYPPVSDQLSDAELVPPAQLAQRLRHFARLAKDAACIFMAGHISLSTYLDDGYFRFGDRLFAIMRDPNEICVSFANYVVGRFASCPGPLGAGHAGVGGGAGADGRRHRAHGPARVRAGAGHAARHADGQSICSLLGDGTARGTLDNLRRAAVEITTAAHYTAWMREAWGIERDGRINSSPQLISWEDLPAWQQARIAAGNAEDRVVFDAVVGCLARLGGRSVCGVEVSKHGALPQTPLGASRPQTPICRRYILQIGSKGRLSLAGSRGVTRERAAHVTRERAAHDAPGLQTNPAPENPQTPQAPSSAPPPRSPPTYTTPATCAPRQAEHRQRHQEPQHQRQQ